MKNFIAVFVFLLFAFCGIAQNLTAKQLFKKYKRQPEVTSFTLPGFAAKIGSWFVDSGDTEVKFALKKIRSIKFAVAESVESKRGLMRLNKWSASQLNPGIYEPLVTIMDGKDEVQFLINEDVDTIKELVMFVKGDEDLMMMVINGKFKIEDINKMVQNIDVRSN